LNQAFFFQLNVLLNQTMIRADFQNIEIHNHIDSSLLTCV